MIKKLCLPLTILLCLISSAGAASWTVASSGGLVTSYDVYNNQSNISNTVLFTPGATGLYRVSYYEVVTQPATTSSNLPQVNIKFFDGDTNVVWAGAFHMLPNEFSTTPGGNTAGDFIAGDAVISAPAGQPVTIKTSAYASSGATPMGYALHIHVEQIF